MLGSIAAASAAAALQCLCYNGQACVTVDTAGLTVPLVSLAN